MKQPMKVRIFTLFLTIVFWGLSNFQVQAQDIGTGIAWGTLAPGEPMLLNEKFQKFSHFHSRSNTNDSNSRNTADAEGNITAWGYKNDSVKVPIIGSNKGNITFKFYQCAFAPAWPTAYAYRDSVTQVTATPVNTAGVSNGFVEISRLYPSHYTIDGYFLIDLREIEFVEVIQYSHSSCGGTRRGLLLEFSLDNGGKWDTLRYQPGDGWTASFSRDVTTLVKTANIINCTPSAFGMTWEEGIYAENVMLRFGIARNQALRIHDLKIYGTYTGTTKVDTKRESELKIYNAYRKIRISDLSDVIVYDMYGRVVKHAFQTRQISMDDVPAGIYLVKAQAGPVLKTGKVIVY